MLNEKIKAHSLLSFFCILSLLYSPNIFSFSESIVDLAVQLNHSAYEALQNGNYKKSYALSLRAKRQAEISNNNIELARSLSNIASNLAYLGQNKKALEIYNRSLSTAEKENDIPGIERAINNMVSIYNQLEEFDTGLTFRKKQYEISKIKSSKNAQLIALRGLAESYLHLKNLPEASDYLKLAYEELSESPDPFLEVYLLLTKARLQKNNLQHSKALSALNKALVLATENNYHGLIAGIKANIAELYFDNGELFEAEKEALASLEESIKVNIVAKKLQSLQLLADIYESKNDFEKALEQYKTAAEIEKDYVGEKTRQLAEITKIDREVAETKEQLRLSEQQNQITELKLVSQKQMATVWGVASLFSVLLLFFWYYRKTSQKEIVRQLQLNQELRELDKLKDRILTNTSHELRTPLNGIIGMSEIILGNNDKEIDPNIRRSIELVHKSGVQLAAIVGDILDLAQLKAQRIPPKITQFELCTLIDEVMEICRPMLNEPNVGFVFERSQGEIIATQDRQRMQQILFNLVGNAVKFTAEGQVKIWCELLNGNRCRIHIKDSGIGIPKNKIKRVFEGFEQVHQDDARGYGGSGLGLAICQELSQVLEGEIKMQSKLGKGTHVSFIFPLFHSVGVE